MSNYRTPEEKAATRQAIAERDAGYKAVSDEHGGSVVDMKAELAALTAAYTARMTGLVGAMTLDNDAPVRDEAWCERMHDAAAVVRGAADFLTDTF